MNTENLILEQYRETARRAYSWVSFSPDKRGDQTIKDFSDQLSGDLAELPEEARDEYKAKFERLFTTWLNALSRTASAMITGPARFPTERNRKRQNSEQKHYEVFQDWRKRAKKAILKKAEPDKTHLTELERYRAELQAMKDNHELMKQGNVKIKQANKTGEDITEYLKTVFNISPHMIDWTMKFGFGLQNNLANIKRVKARIKELETKQEKAETVGVKSYDFESCKVLIDYADNRIRIVHDQKPDPETISKLKKHGFKWSPFNKAWQRHNTPNTIYVLKNAFNLEVKA